MAAAVACQTAKKGEQTNFGSESIDKPSEFTEYGLELRNKIKKMAFFPGAEKTFFSCIQYEARILKPSL